MAVTEFLTERLLPLIIPMPCLGCDRLIERGHHFLGLCVRCRNRLKPLGDERCAGCGRPLRGFAIPTDYRCGRCRREPPAYDRLVALWAFRPPMDAVIHGLKFERLEFLGGYLAVEIANHLRATRPPTEPPVDLVTWVPLHWRRFLERGYNQAERIARPLARELGLPAARLLTRTRATPAQTSLARRQRAGNLKGALRARRPARVRDRLAGKRILLVDDVTTTGSTFGAAAASLRAAGAAGILAVAAARTPGPDEPRARKTVIW